MSDEPGHPKDIYPDRHTARELVGLGWWPLVNAAYDAVELRGRRLFQVKEKFGGLRLYPEHDPAGGQDLYDVLDRLMAQSLTVCEACGAHGVMRYDLGWQKTLCERCHLMMLNGARWIEIFGFQPYTTPADHFRTGGDAV